MEKQLEVSSPVVEVDVVVKVPDPAKGRQAGKYRRVMKVAAKFAKRQKFGFFV